MNELNQQDEAVKGLFLSRNFGHQAALCAGLEAAAGRAVVTIDGDLQDPPELIPQLLDKWNQGYYVVYAKRRRRKENPFKKGACYLYYRILRRLSDISIPMDTGDFALMDRQAVNHLINMPERTRFIRGLRSWVGFPQTDVEYIREPRRDGLSKYSVGRLIHLGLDGLIGFSDKPLKAVMMTGVFTFLSSLVGLAGGLMTWQTAWGVPLLLLGATALIGSLQLMAIGVLGEYMGRVYTEVRNRPLYLLKKKTGFERHPRLVPHVADFLDNASSTQEKTERPIPAGVGAPDDEFPRHDRY
jgi:dolichol-phosphate mannosyltransferase